MGLAGVSVGRSAPLDSLVVSVALVELFEVVGVVEVPPMADCSSAVVATRQAHCVARSR